jgi:hypothetical protein
MSATGFKFAWHSPALALLAAIAGVGLGVAAWGEGRAPVLAVLLPLGVAICRTRGQAFALAAGYAAGVLRFVATFIASWFDDQVMVGVGALAIYMLATGLVWCIGWSGSPNPWRRALAMSAAWVLALAAGVAVPGHPLIAAGFLLPGTGWLGVAWSLLIALAGAALAPPAIAKLAQLTLRSALGWTALVAGPALAALAVLSLAEGGTPSRSGPVAGAVAVSTTWGKGQGFDSALTRMQLMGANQVAAAATAVFWPESILGRWDPSLFGALRIEVLRGARRTGRTVVIGMDIFTPGERALNAAVAFYPDGSTQTAIARQPAPGSLWRPWQSTHTFVADWGASNMLMVGSERAALIFCYEEYVPLLYLLNEMRDAPTMYVALTNTWAARQRTAATIQTWHSYGMARLFGRPYLKAENGPERTSAPGSAPGGPASIAAAR